MTAPIQPFQISVTARDRARPEQMTYEWAVPFDTAFRPLELANANEGSRNAYAAIGRHVSDAGARYCPAYKIANTLNMRSSVLPPVLSKWQTDTMNGLVVINRNSGIAYHLLPSFSIREAVTSFFVRETYFVDQVLCYDPNEGEHGVWYTEPKRQDLIVYLNDAGQEVPHDEGKPRDYKVELHPHAIMVHGE